MAGNTVMHTSGLILEPKSHIRTPKTHEGKSLDLFVLLPNVVTFSGFTTTCIIGLLRMVGRPYLVRELLGLRL